MRRTWYQLPLRLQEDRPDAERRSRLAIEITERRAERDRWIDLVRNDDWFDFMNEDRITAAHNRGLRACAEQIIGETL